MLLLAALVALVALPLGYVVADVGEGADDPAPRPVLVLPAGASGEASTGPGRQARTPDRTGEPSPVRSPSPPPQPPDDPCDDGRDDERGDDDDDDRIDVVRPCPDDFGDDDDGDDRGDTDDRDDD